MCCSALIEINFPLFKTNQVSNMSNMFSGCSSLIELNLSSFKTNKVKKAIVKLSEGSSIEL